MHVAARALAVAIPLALAACDNPVDTTENQLPYQSERDTAVDTTDADVVDTGCDCLVVGDWYRFDALVLQSLAGDPEHPVISTLNGIWASDIAKRELNLFLEITAASPTEVSVNVYSGGRVDGTGGDSAEACFFGEAGTALTIPRAGCGIGPSPPLDFDIFAGTPMFTKTCAPTLPAHAIPVAQAIVSGRLTDDCGAIVDGVVPAGGLGEDELGAVCTCLQVSGGAAEDCGTLDPEYTGGGCDGCSAKFQNLEQLLEVFGAVPFDCKTADDRPAACITAGWSAARLDASPGTCAP